MMQVIIFSACYLLVMCLLYVGMNSGHKWVYRNPGSRRCKKCGLLENQYDNGFTTRWEPMNRLTSPWWCPGNNNIDR